MTEEWTAMSGDASIAGLLDRAHPQVALMAVAHGAGNDMRSPYLAGIAQGLVAHDVSCVRFNFPYAQRGRRSPDPPRVLMDAWRSILTAASEERGSAPVIASGKSLGGRMASMVAAEDGQRFAARALVFFGYPLHAPGKADQPRDEHLASIEVPMLFIEGTADPFARFDLIENVVERLGPRARLHVIEGGDHSHQVRGARRPPEEVGQDLGAIAAAFVREVTGV
jgi:uncharacterized protein